MYSRQLQPRQPQLSIVPHCEQQRQQQQGLQQQQGQQQQQQQQEGRRLVGWLSPPFPLIPILNRRPVYHVFALCQQQVSPVNPPNSFTSIMFGVTLYCASLIFLLLVGFLGTTITAKSVRRFMIN